MPNILNSDKDIRDALIEKSILEGFSSRTIAKNIGCSLSTISKVRKSMISNGIKLNSIKQNSIDTKQTSPPGQKPKKFPHIPETEIIKFVKKCRARVHTQLEDIEDLKRLINK